MALFGSGGLGSFLLFQNNLAVWQYEVKKKNKKKKSPLLFTQGGVWQVVCCNCILSLFFFFLLLLLLLFLLLFWALYDNLYLNLSPIRTSFWQSVIKALCSGALFCQGQEGSDALFFYVGALFGRWRLLLLGAVELVVSHCECALFLFFSDLPFLNAPIIRQVNLPLRFLSI